ncbi:MAG: DUF3871 family protein [Muribaculum sp.]|nr:DUF3871 family protein [Muribaculum sp.]
MATTNSLAVIPSGIMAPQPTWEIREQIHDSNESHPIFIEGPSAEISMLDLTTKNIIPTFSDNSLTISHQKFIETTRKAAEVVFGNGNVTTAEARVSHPIIGRIPSAQHKTQITEDERTVFFMRLAWISHITTMNTSINGQQISLTIGGTRSYHEDKLFARKNPQHFRIFIGFRVRVCSNMMLTCDGVSENLLCMTEADIFQHAIQLFQHFNEVKETTLYNLENLHNVWLSQEQFCKILGRLRLYQALPNAQQKQLPQILLGDSVINAATREYIKNPNFGMGNGDGSISCWQLMQLLNEAVKNSYSDLWIERNANCTTFATGISNAINGNDSQGYSWFLN